MFTVKKNATLFILASTHRITWPLISKRKPILQKVIRKLQWNSQMKLFKWFRHEIADLTVQDVQRGTVSWTVLFGNILSVKIDFVKSQGIYLESGLVSAFNGWTSQKMHEILLCLIFEAVVDVRWKSFLVCWITWMLNFFQMKYFDVDTHEHLILEVYTSLVNVRGTPYSWEIHEIIIGARAIILP